MVGSDNLNIRSWTNDSELSCAVIDERARRARAARPRRPRRRRPRLARDTRLRLWREHLGRDDGDDGDLVDPVAGIEVLRRSAAALDAWQRPPHRTAAARPAAPHRPVRAVVGEVVGPAAAPHARRPRRPTPALRRAGRF